MVTFIELRNFGLPFKHPLQIKFSETLYKKKKELGYYPDYIDVNEYITHNDHIVGGWVNSLSSHLKSYNLSLKWFDGSEKPFSACDEDGIYLISVMTAMYRLAKKAISHIKEQQPDAKVIVGGVHPTLKPIETLNELGADYVVCSEADNIIAPLIRTIKKSEKFINVPGIYYKRGVDVLFTGNPPLPEASDIQLDWKLHLKYTHPTMQCIPNIYTTRDCPYRCNFCSIIKRRKFRQIPVRNVINQIKDLQEKLDGHPLHLRVEDPTFLVSLKYANEFVDEISKLSGISWVCDTRIDKPCKDIERLFKKMVDSNCSHVFFGVESSLQHVLNNMNKGIKSEYVVPFLNMASECGINTHTGWIMGFPNQTREDIKQDINVIIEGLEEGYISTANYRFLIIYPGNLYEIEKDRFRIKLHYTKDNYEKIEQEVTHSTSYLMRGEIWRLYLWGLEKLLGVQK